MNPWVSNRGFCWTATATPGLLKILQLEKSNLSTNAYRSTDTKKKLFFGRGVLTYKGGRAGVGEWGWSHVMLERWNIAGSFVGTRIYQVWALSNLWLFKKKIQINNAGALTCWRKLWGYKNFTDIRRAFYWFKAIVLLQKFKNLKNPKSKQKLLENVSSLIKMCVMIVENLIIYITLFVITFFFKIFLLK